MPQILTGIACVLLVLIAIEDFKYLKIRLIWYMLLFPSLISASLLSITPTVWISTSLINIIIVLTIFFCGSLLVLIKNKWSLQKLKTSIGLGDVLILSALAVCMSSMFFVISLQSSLVLSLIYFLFRRKTLQKNNNRVPLAGVCASLLILILSSNLIFSIPPLYNDFWFLYRLGLL